jgi:hypothetical protein
MELGAESIPALDRLKQLLQSKNRSESKILFLAKNWTISPEGTEPDFSYFAVVSYPTIEWLQIQSPRDKLLITIVSPDKPTIRVDELYKFCDLLWRGDIVAVEALYLEEHIIFQSEEWRELVSRRRSFALTRLLLSHYAGQPRAQLMYKTKTVDWYNVWKWLYEADQLLEVTPLQQLPFPLPSPLCRALSQLSCGPKKAVQRRGLFWNRLQVRCEGTTSSSS